MGYYDFISGVELINTCIFLSRGPWTASALSPFQQGALDTGPARLAQSHEGQDGGIWRFQFGDGSAATLQAWGSQTRCTAFLSFGFRCKWKWERSHVFHLVSHMVGFMAWMGAIFSFRRQHPKGHNKRCYKQRERQSSVLQWVGVETSSICGPGKAGGEGPTSEE